MKDIPQLISKKRNIIDNINKVLIKNNITKTINLEFSNRLKAYRAKAVYSTRQNNNELIFKISSEYLDISEEIILGLIYTLLQKIYKEIILDQNSIFLYNSFIKQLSDSSIGQNISDERLLDSFNRVNNKYFNSELLLPNIIWGKDTKTKLASYDLFSNTVTISSIFKKYYDVSVVDFLMYHELLHKYLKFKTSKTQNQYHTSEFRALEDQFENKDLVEKKISQIIKLSKRK